MDGHIEKLPAKAETKQDKLIRNLFLYDSVQQAALQAGYTKNTAQSTIYQLIKKKHFQERVREYAIEHDLLNIPKILRIETQILNHLEENPLDLPKFKDTIKQKKQIAGLLKKDEDQPGSVVVNVKYLQNMMLKAHE